MNTLRNGAAPCSDGFRLNEIRIVNTEAVSVIKEALCDAAPHVSQANEPCFYPICRKKFHKVSVILE
jgi:hypothetical protein